MTTGRSTGSTLLLLLLLLLLVITVVSYGECCLAFNPTVPTRRLTTRRQRFSTSASTRPDVTTPLFSVSAPADASIVPPTRNSARTESVSRAKSTKAFTEWAKSNGIEIGAVDVSSGEVADGLGLVLTRDAKPGDVLVQVPTSTVLSVTIPGEYNRGARELFDNKDVYRDAPWWAQLSVQLNRYDLVSSLDLESGIDMRGWLDSLPRKFDTPIHWTDSTLEELQYRYLSDSVASQKRQWFNQYKRLVNGAGPSSPLQMTFADFVWGCEIARSRAFSGSYSGSAFNPLPYALTIVLVSAYVGLNLGSLEQAANGAALVVCGSILNDFVLPKLRKTKKYVICPFIDMCNHKGSGERGDVAFEFFGDAYSLSVKGGTVREDEELFISYGARSNDQLLMYYGFVEKNNPHDVYIMPQLREWNIARLEEACGRPFAAGRLAKLEKAGLLGFIDGNSSESDDDSAANRGGGVVVSRAGGIDPSIMQALRALVATDKEWEDASEAIGNFAAETSGGPQTERLARLAARTALEIELASKPTTIKDDRELLKRMDSHSIEEKLAIQFRIEKKMLLEECISQLLS